MEAVSGDLRRRRMHRGGQNIDWYDIWRIQSYSAHDKDQWKNASWFEIKEIRIDGNEMVMDDIWTVEEFAFSKDSNNMHIRNVEIWF